MDVRQVGPLRVRMFVTPPGPMRESAGQPPLTVVLMHGYGAPGDDLISLAGAIEAPAGTTFVFPEATTVLDPMFGDARAWWTIDIGRYERAMRSGMLEPLIKDEPAGMAGARDAVTAMLDALAKETDDAMTPRLVLGGFSQGSMLATDVALRTKRPLAGLVILSGTLLASDEWVPRMGDRKGLRVFQSHGTSDPILPFALAERFRDLLVEAEVDVTFSVFAGGHGIAPSVVRDLGRFLRGLP